MGHTLEPPPFQIEEFNDKWRTWLHNLWHNTHGIEANTPASIAFEPSGGSSSDTLSDMTTFADGNTYVIAEANAQTPGQDLRLTFNNVGDRVNGVLCSAYYNGGASHYVTIELYNYKMSRWDIFIRYTTSSITEVNYRHVEIPSDIAGNYVSNRSALGRVHHALQGMNGHATTIDYIAIF